MITVIPFCNKDAVLTAKNLEWIFQLDGKTNHRCLLSWEQGTNQSHIDRIRSLAAATFIEVKEYEYPEAVNKRWPAGPNWAWQSTARYIPMAYTNKEPWFWLEADAVPLKSRWIDILEAEYKSGGKPFMGHIVKEMGHMNGVAVYPNKVDDICWKPLLVENAAWDSALKEETIELTHRANHIIQHCWVLINGQVAPFGDGPVATFRDTADVKRLIEPHAVIFHRCKDGSLIDCLHAMHAVKECNEHVLTVDDLPKYRNDFPIYEPSKAENIVASTATANTGETTARNVSFKEEVIKRTEDWVTVKVTAPPTVLLVPHPKTEIFIVTYFKDAEWLQYSLYSIKKFARGFTGVTVVCPDRDIEIIEPICREWGPEDTTIEMFEEPEGKGMLAHMAIECMADQYVEGRADYVLHTDSDCIFIEPVTPADYFVDGKPVLLKEAYERFRVKHPGVLQWQDRTQKALGKPVENEYMRRHPAVHPVILYHQVRDIVSEVQKKPFWDWAISGRNEYPQDWSEYNLLGAVAHEVMQDRYHWIDCAGQLRPQDKIAQFWGHGGLDRPTDTGAWPGETPRNIIKRILGV